MFLTLLCQSLVTDRISIEHKYLSALFAMPRMLDTALFAEVALLPFAREPFDRAAFMEKRPAILEGVSEMSRMCSAESSDLFRRPGRSGLIADCWIDQDTHIPVHQSAGVCDGHQIRCECTSWSGPRPPRCRIRGWETRLCGLFSRPALILRR